MHIKSWPLRYSDDTIKPHQTGHKATIHDVEDGIVKIFTHDGSPIGRTPHRAFTNLRTSMNGRFYDATLGRCYHPRWFRRLASMFLDQCREHDGE